MQSTCVAHIEALMFHFPTLLGLSLSRFLGSYEFIVWMLLLLAFLDINCLFYIIYKTIYKFPRIFLMVLALSVNEAVPIPRIHSAKIRFTVSFWLIFVLLISTGYKSQLIASLTHPGSLGYVPSTFAELSSRSEYKIHFHHINGAAVSFFANNSSPVVSTLCKRLVVKTIADCVSDAFDFNSEKAACITWDGLAKTFIASHNYGTPQN